MIDDFMTLFHSFYKLLLIIGIFNIYRLSFGKNDTWPIELLRIDNVKMITVKFISQDFKNQWFQLFCIDNHLITIMNKNIENQNYIKIWIEYSKEIHRWIWQDVVIKIPEFTWFWTNFTWNLYNLITDTRYKYHNKC